MIAIKIWQLVEIFMKLKKRIMELRLNQNELRLGLLRLRDTGHKYGRAQVRWTLNRIFHYFFSALRFERRKVWLIGKIWLIHSYTLLKISYESDGR